MLGKGPSCDEGGGQGAEHDVEGSSKWQGRDRDGQMCSFCPLLLNGQVPLPGEVVVLVVIGEEGLVVVGASSQHAFGSLLNRSQELILLWPRPVAANHKCGFIHWEEREVR